MNLSDDNLELYNKESSLYNDICYTLTSENGTDMSINDRRKQFLIHLFLDKI